MSEEAPKPQTDLNKLRDDVLAGRPTGYEDHVVDPNVHTHFVNPDLHPDHNPGPSIYEIRRALAEQSPDKQPGQAENHPE
jgi:hypothetical protein